LDGFWGTCRRLVRNGSSHYLAVLLVCVSVFQAIHYRFPANRAFGDIPPATVVAFVMVALAAALWSAYRPAGQWDVATRWELALLIALWLFTVEDSRSHGDVITPLVVLMPIAVFLIAAKRPDRVSLDLAADAFAWSVVILCLGFLLIQAVGPAPGPATAITVFERDTYWLPLADVFRLPGRWYGPFGHPNIASPLGVFLVVYGITRPGVRRIAFTATGVLILLLTATRSSMIAVVVGVVLLAALDRRVIRGRAYGRYLVLAGLVGAFALAAVLVVRNPILNGRTVIWPQYVELWKGSPLVGVGDPGIGVAIEQGLLPDWAVHGHNVLLDALTRYGILAAALVAGVLALAAWITGRAALRGRPLGVALITTLVIGGLTETLFDWRYLTFTLAILVLAVVLSADDADESPAVPSAGPVT
jgi:O-antigen ligase